MIHILRNLARSRQARWLGVALTITVMGVAGCGGDDGDAAGPTAPSSAESDSSASGEAADEPIVIETRMTLTSEKKIVSSGSVLDGSTVGDSPFCPGGTIEDKHGATPEVALVDRTVTCTDGTLKIGFSPQVPEGNTQSGPWRIVGGSGAYEEWLGSGEMKMVYDRGSGSTKGNETFTGTVTH